MGTGKGNVKRVQKATDVIDNRISNPFKDLARTCHGRVDIKFDNKKEVELLKSVESKSFSEYYLEKESIGRTTGKEQRKQVEYIVNEFLQDALSRRIISFETIYGNSPVAGRIDYKDREVEEIFYNEILVFKSQEEIRIKVKFNSGINGGSPHYQFMLDNKYMDIERDDNLISYAYPESWTHDQLNKKNGHTNLMYTVFNTLFSTGN